MEEIPSAKTQVPITLKPLTAEESQVKQCVEATKKINKCFPSVNLKFMIPLQEELRLKLIEKGFRVVYDLNYDSSNDVPYVCNVTISNPDLIDEKARSDGDVALKFFSQFLDKMSTDATDSEKAAYGLLSSFLGGSTSTGG